MADNILPFPGMPPPKDFERIEHRMLNYLRQSANPLVPVEKLYAHMKRDPACHELTEAALLELLRAHGETMLFEGLPRDAGIGAEDFAAVGILMGPRAILKERMPSKREMEVMLVGQVQEMQRQLQRALEKTRDTEKIRALRAALARADALQQRIARMLAGASDEKESTR
jgi:hypothetical protein